jgi:ribosomal-protein-alanine N-acetyltransferase
MYHPFIVGKKLYLRGLEKSDLSGDYFQWANDSDVTRYMFMGSRPNNLENLEEEYESLRKSNTDIALLIVDKKTDKVIGTTGFYRIDWIGRTAEYRIVIGGKEFWGRGHGTETAKLMLCYGFEKLNLNKVWLGVNVENPVAIKSYENAGFIREGVLRQEIYRNSKYYDAIRMSVLREEYYKNKDRFKV